MKYLGYCKDQVHPFQKGEEIIIPKGTIVKSMNPSKREYTLKRNQKIKIAHLRSGMDCPEYHYKRYYSEKQYPTKEVNGEKRYCIANPGVSWAGGGGYWCEVDVNDLLKANGRS
jgi:hypothetical protein